MRKIKNVFLVLVVLLSLFIWWPNRAAANGVNYGDVNNDGSINVNDVILVLQDVVQYKKINEIYGSEGSRRAKVSIGKKIEVGDAILILRRIVNLIQNFPIEQTLLTGPARSSVKQAQQWVKNRGESFYHQRFIDIAPVYWEYGEQTGIRPEVLYAQAAKETNFGRFTGRVQPSQNNWAGIKIANPSGDETEDHESFATPEDGVRGHFNHMSAYIHGNSRSPIGEPHPRYSVVLTTSWAGTVWYVEELGGQWAPDPAYGQSIVDNYLQGILTTPFP